MAKYVYPAVLTPEDQMYSVQFPDLDGCSTCGNTLAEAIEMAEDALAFALYNKEKRHEEIPAPSEVTQIDLPAGSFTNLIACDTLIYQQKYNKHSVRKTLTIPEWLDVIARENHANFSQDLQEILTAKYVDSRRS